MYNEQMFQQSSKKVSEFLKYVYRFDGYMISFNSQELTIEEYMNLVTSKYLDSVFLVDVTIKMMDGSFATVETILKPLVLIENLQL